jgi:hypothetical protein
MATAIPGILHSARSDSAKESKPSSGSEALADVLVTKRTSPIPITSACRRITSHLPEGQKRGKAREGGSMIAFRNDRGKTPESGTARDEKQLAR